MLLFEETRFDKAHVKKKGDLERDACRGGRALDSTGHGLIGTFVPAREREREVEQTSFEEEHAWANRTTGDPE